FFGAIGNDAHTPIGLVVVGGEGGDHLLGLAFVGEAEPHGDGGKDARLVHALVVVTLSKRKNLFFGGPEGVVEVRPFFFELRGDRCGVVVFSGELRKVCQGVYGGSGEAALIKLGFDGKKRAAFYPAVADAEVAREAVGVVGGAEKFVGLGDVRPVGFGEF